MTALALTVAGAVLIGLSLGLLGGGGSILAVPLLVYVAGLPAKEAIATSLLVVGVTSAVGVLPHARAGRIRWRTGLVFGVAGMAGAYAGGRLAEVIPSGVLLTAFALMMLATAGAMIRGRRGAGDRPVPDELPMVRVVLDGMMVGLTTGLVGAGGGFLVVPALVLLGGLPMPVAVGTSLLVIAMKSVAGLAGYLSSVHVDWALAVAITAAAVAGSLLGGLLGGRVPERALRLAFGWFVVVMGGFVLVQQAPAGLLTTPLARVLAAAAAAAAAAAVAVAVVTLARRHLAVRLTGGGPVPHHHHLRHAGSRARRSRQCRVVAHRQWQLARAVPARPAVSEFSSAENGHAQSWSTPMAVEWRAGRGRRSVPDKHEQAEHMRHDVPSTIARSDDKAVRTYKKTLESAEETYGDGERAHRTAYAALKHAHEKVGDHWEPKEQAGPSDPQAARTAPASTERPVETAGGVDVNASREHLDEVARKVGVGDPETMDRDDLIRAIEKANARATARARRK